MHTTRAALVAELEAARAGHALVRVHRARTMERLEGYVVAVGRRWLLLARLADGLWLHGWTAIRLKDVRRVRRSENAAFVQQALRLRGQWPPSAPDVAPDLSSVEGLLSSAQAQEALVAIHPELDDPDVCLIGVVRRVGRRRVRLQEVTPAARWRATTTSFALEGLTRVDIGGSYEAALRSVAGPPPR